jgi:hypothetical protein
MILLITCSLHGGECKAVLQRGTGERVQIAENLGEATGALRDREYAAVVIDQDLARVDKDGESALLHACGVAVPVYVNLAISGAERVLAEVRGALRRRQAERLVAMKIASSELRDELKGAVTGILLSSELAMSVPELPRSAQVKIKFVHDLAQGMRRQLEAS